MKIAVLSDIHGNKVALQTVAADIERWNPDKVIVNGDIINRGPNNKFCWEFVKEKERTAGWQLVRGNHEDYVLLSADPAAPQSGPQFELRQFSEWTFAQVGHYKQQFAALPDRHAIHAPDGSTLLITHGTMKGNRVGVYPESTDDELASLINPGPAIFVTAHTHRALTRQIGQTTIVNIGSSGLPFDGNWHPCYGRFTWTPTTGWQNELRRIPYDRDQAIQNLQTSGFMAEAGPFSKLVLVEYRTAHGMIGKWGKVYQKAFLAGEINLAESVDRYLAEVGLEDKAILSV